MYSNKLVVAVKVGGKILRERKDTVLVPFGSEYSVLVKNLNSVRIKFKLSIDGQDQTDGTWIVVHPNTDIEMERSIRNGNWTTGNKFKFIERTAEIEEHRGIKADDGIVRVEALTEKVIPVFLNTPTWPYVERRSPWVPPYDRRRWPERRLLHPYRSLRPSASAGPPSASYYSHVANTCQVDTTTSGTVGAALGDAGITVPGGQSNQQFYATSDFLTEGAAEVIVLHLRGRVGAVDVSEPVTVDVKPKCNTCGRANPVASKFCANCGTALVLY